jgi:hypothetical protein
MAILCCMFQVPLLRTPARPLQLVREVPAIFAHSIEKPMVGALNESAREKGRQRESQLLLLETFGLPLLINQLTKYPIKKAQPHLVPATRFV